MAERKVFVVVDTIYNEIEFGYANCTNHWVEERVERHSKIEKHIGGGKLIKSFEVYTAHPNGNEIHNIFDNGVVLIQNIHTKKLITELIARPGQIRRYWDGLYQQMPYNYKYITDKAYQHQLRGWNLW